MTNLPNLHDRQSLIVSSLPQPSTANQAAPGEKGAAPNETGATIVEFAFTVSIFIFAFFGLLWGTMVFFGWLTTSNAAREGARCAIDLDQCKYSINNTSADTFTAIKTYICQTSPGLGGTSSGCLSDMSSSSGSCTSSNTVCLTVEPSDSTTWVYDTQVSITVKFLVPVPTLSIPFLTGGRFTLLAPIWVQSNAVMRIS